MTRLNLLVEGQTEQTFVRDTLAPHLANAGTVAAARCVQTSKSQGRVYRGGLRTYQSLRKDLQKWMSEDNSAWLTTMVDLHRLPADFPGYQAAAQCPDVYQRVAVLEEAFGADVGHQRFVPYIQVHEFEALLFSDVSKFRRFFAGQEQGVRKLEQVVACFGNPELIDDGPNTAPSKRITDAIRGYSKRSDGPSLAAEIGLPVMRDRCPHFHTWLTTLENL